MRSSHPLLTWLQVITTILQNWSIGGTLHVVSSARPLWFRDRFSKKGPANTGRLTLDIVNVSA